MPYCDAWCKSAADKHYHDTEWGRPLRDERALFEFLILEVMQCGLSWQLILKKRAIMRHCFDNFDFTRIARYTQRDITRILNTPGMIKSPRKIKAVIQNANAFLKVRQAFGSFSAFLWAYSLNKTIIYSGHCLGKVPVSNGLSARISRELKTRGFTFLGPVTVYSYLQSCGIINDHSAACPLFKHINNNHPNIKMPRDSEVF